MALFNIEDIQDNQILAPIREDEEIPSEYEIDFETGQLTGRVVTGAEAVAVWAWLCIQTMRYEYMLYSHEYGCEIHEIIGQKYSRDYIYALAKFMLEDALTVNPYITGIDDFNIEEERGSLYISFLLVTEFGEVEVEADV